MNKKWVRLILISLVATITGFTIGFVIYRIANQPVNQNLTALPSFDPSAPAPSTPTDRLVIATIDVPSANILSLPVTVGTDDATLNTGMAGAYEWSELGKPGMFALAGHRVGAGGPFRHLDLVHIGDRITVSAEGTAYTYRVIANDVVDPNDVSVLRAPASATRIVLITCTPLNTFAKRLVVTGELIPAKSK